MCSEIGADNVTNVIKTKFMFMLMFLYSFEWCILHKLQNSENESDVWMDFAYSLNLIGL